MARLVFFLHSIVVLVLAVGCSSSTNGPPVPPADGDVARYLEAHPELNVSDAQAPEGAPVSVDD